MSKNKYRKFACETGQISHSQKSVTASNLYHVITTESHWMSACVFPLFHAWTWQMKLVDACTQANWISWSHEKTRMLYPWGLHRKKNQKNQPPLFAFCLIYVENASENSKPLFLCSAEKMCLVCIKIENANLSFRCCELKVQHNSVLNS